MTNEFFFALDINRADALYGKTDCQLQPLCEPEQTTYSLPQTTQLSMSPKCRENP